MNRFSVLFLEDEEEHIKIMEGALNSNSKFITYTTVRMWDEAARLLKEERFDIVIADVFIFEDAKDAVKNPKGIFRCLEKLLEITESIYPPIPVAVYTGKEDINKIEDLLPRICDFWDKRQVSPGFLAFRISKIRDLIERERPDSLLIKMIREGIRAKAPTGDELLWGQKIEAMLDKYEEYDTAMDQAQTMSSKLSTIAGELGFSEHFTEGIRVLMEIDTAVSSLLVNSRPHLRHCMNTFLLGYYLLNLSDIDWKNILQDANNAFSGAVATDRANGFTKADAVNRAWHNVNVAWFCASLLHDVGIVVEYQKTVSERLDELIGSLEVATLSKPHSFHKVSDETRQSMIDRIATISSEDVMKVIRRLADTNTSDHGLVSSLFIAQHCYDEVKESSEEVAKGLLDALLTAAEAVAIHNELTDPEMCKLDFGENLIAAMLVFCDSIQSWERESPDFSLLRGGQIDKVELCELNTMIRKDGKIGPSISMTVRYYPHMGIARHTPSLDSCEEKLIGILQKHVIRPLKRKLRFSTQKELLPKFKVSFQLGMDEIERLEIPYSSTTAMVSDV